MMCPATIVSIFEVGLSARIPMNPISANASPPTRASATVTIPKRNPFIATLLLGPYPAAVASFVGSKTTFRTAAGGGSGLACHTPSASDTPAVSAYLILSTTLQALRLFLKHRHLHHVNLTLVRIHVSAQFDVVPHVVL